MQPYLEMKAAADAFDRAFDQMIDAPVGRRPTQARVDALSERAIQTYSAFLLWVRDSPAGVARKLRDAAEAIEAGGGNGEVEAEAVRLADVLDSGCPDPRFAQDLRELIDRRTAEVNAASEHDPLAWARDNDAILLLRTALAGFRLRPVRE